MKRALVSLAAALALVLAAVPGRAEARSTITVTYAAGKVFSTAVRFLRVDEQATVIEKDAESGYVIFEIVSDQKTYRGALELIETEKDGRAVVTVAITLTDRPDYLEATMLERLRRKLRAELGDEPPAPPRPRPAPAPAPAPANPGTPPAPSA